MLRPKRRRMEAKIYSSTMPDAVSALDEVTSARFMTFITKHYVFMQEVSPCRWPTQTIRPGISRAQRLPLIAASPGRRMTPCWLACCWVGGLVNLPLPVTPREVLHGSLWDQLGLNLLVGNHMLNLFKVQSPFGLGTWSWLASACCRATRFCASAGLEGIRVAIIC